MTQNINKSEPKRILLSGVFGPYGVDDEFGRKENIMELFHNQVTKAQGLASWRFHHRSFGLYFIAANIDADVTVLDFPSRKRFMREVKKGYDIVGISFITPNFSKAREMARATRELAPGATIILGGHGAAIEDVEKLIDCDHVVKGEGIGWMRKYLGQDPDAPIVHPTLTSTERRSIMGIPIMGKPANLLVPGVGCVNGCKFCSTSHFFSKKSVPFISTGKELFDTAARIADKSGSSEFFVLDENFLKDRGRALDFLVEMEKNQRFFSFSIFSSAEAITAFGIDNLVRLGADFVWIGVESPSRQASYQKNVGIEVKELVTELRDRGIAVLTSGILCEEHHTPNNISADIDGLINLEPDLVQFMLLTPLPTTALYNDHKSRDLLREDIPFEEWHGQKTLVYRHPAFPGDLAEKWIAHAFRKDYEVNSSSIYRLVSTVFKGYKHLAALPKRDACLESRFQRYKRMARVYSGILPSIARHPVNALEKKRAFALEQEISQTLGAPPTVEKLRRAAAGVCVSLWALRLKLKGDEMQPSTIITKYDLKAKTRSAKLGVETAAKKLMDAGDEIVELGLAARESSKHAV